MVNIVRADICLKYIKNIFKIFRTPKRERLQKKLKK